MYILSPFSPYYFFFTYFTSPFFFPFFENTSFLCFFPFFSFILHLFLSLFLKIACTPTSFMVYTFSPLFTLRVQAYIFFLLFLLIFTNSTSHFYNKILKNTSFFLPFFSFILNMINIQPLSPILLHHLEIYLYSLIYHYLQSHEEIHLYERSS